MKSKRLAVADGVDAMAVARELMIRDVAGHGRAWRGKAGLGEARHGKARRGNLTWN